MLIAAYLLYCILPFLILALSIKAKKTFGIKKRYFLTYGLSVLCTIFGVVFNLPFLVIFPLLMVIVIHLILLIIIWSLRVLTK